MAVSGEGGAAGCLLPYRPSSFHYKPLSFTSSSESLHCEMVYCNTYFLSWRPANPPPMKSFLWWNFHTISTRHSIHTPYFIDWDFWHNPCHGIPLSPGPTVFPPTSFRCLVFTSPQYPSFLVSPILVKKNYFQHLHFHTFLPVIPWFTHVTPEACLLACHNKIQNVIFVKRIVRW